MFKVANFFLQSLRIRGIPRLKTSSSRVRWNRSSFPIIWGIIGSRMSYPDTHSHQPECGHAVATLMTGIPCRPIILIHPGREPIVSEDFCQSVFNSSPALILTGLQAHREPGMIVQNSKRIAAPVKENLVPLKVHLPQLVGRADLKTDIPPSSLSRF